MQLINKSLYNIRIDHLELLQQIEENEGELTPELEQAIQLTEEEFESKAISYGFVYKGFDDTIDLIDQEIKRLNGLKEKAKKRAEAFKEILSDAMKQFSVEKIETPIIKLSFRKSKAIELSEDFEDSILKYVDIAPVINEEKIKAAKEAGEDVPKITEELLQCFTIKVNASKTNLGKLLDEGVTISGVTKVENKSLQIK